MATFLCIAAALAAPAHERPVASLRANATAGPDATAGPEVVNSTVEEVRPAVFLADKQNAEAASIAADRKVTGLEKLRDEAWRSARGSLALASNPPIRSASVLGLLSAERDRFAKIEADIKTAKTEAQHHRRIAELAGGAFDALESFKLKSQRVETADGALRRARAERDRAHAQEAEMLRELAIERARVL